MSRRREGVPVTGTCPQFPGYHCPGPWITREFDEFLHDLDERLRAAETLLGLPSAEDLSEAELAARVREIERALGVGGGKRAVDARRAVAWLVQLAESAELRRDAALFEVARYQRWIEEDEADELVELVVTGHRGGERPGPA